MGKESRKLKDFFFLNNVFGPIQLESKAGRNRTYLKNRTATNQKYSHTHTHTHTRTHTTTKKEHKHNTKESHQSTKGKTKRKKGSKEEIQGQWENSV